MTATTPRPTTTAAVDADLKARADFRGIDERGQVHYLLGMCEALLAQANSEIARLERKNAPVILDTLRECADLLDDYSDVNDGEDGQPVSNRAMSLLRDVEVAIAKAEGR